MGLRGVQFPECAKIKVASSSHAPIATGAITSVARSLGSGSGAENPELGRRARAQWSRAAPGLREAAEGGCAWTLLTVVPSARAQGQLPRRLLSPTPPPRLRSHLHSTAGEGEEPSSAEPRLFTRPALKGRGRAGPRTSDSSPRRSSFPDALNHPQP